MGEMLPIFIRSGTIIAQSLAADHQDSELLPIENYRNSDDKGLIIALDDQLQASGEQYWDDGISQNPTFAEVKFTFEDLTLTAQLDDNERFRPGQYFWRRLI